MHPVEGGHADAGRLRPSRSRPDWHVLEGLRRAIDTLLDDLALPAGARAFDMGCGDRPYEPLFAERGIRYVGGDLGAGADVVIEPERALPLGDAEFDLAVSFQVLEHVWDLDWYLGELKRILKPGGSMLLSTHGAWLYHPHPQDFRRWTRAGLVREIEDRGWRVERTIAVSGPLAWSLIVRAIAAREALSRFGGAGRMVAALVCRIYNLRIAMEERITPAAVRESNACVYVCRCTPRGAADVAAPAHAAERTAAPTS